MHSFPGGCSQVISVLRSTFIGAVSESAPSAANSRGFKALLMFLPYTGTLFLTVTKKKLNNLINGGEKRGSSAPTSRSAERPLDGAVKYGSKTTGSQLVSPMDVSQHLEPCCGNGPCGLLRIRRNRSALLLLLLGFYAEKGAKSDSPRGEGKEGQAGRDTQKQGVTALYPHLPISSTVERTTGGECR
ncbi:uncharacterized protein LOC112842046 isoform X2 [Oreochromis niloticus]|uniref:uncharacterized protein LOC112842046 isoform X2 n=1 Tax=Oreochromis niloticus TaxID=8128 RepID=UPI000DF2F519|nr:uncharacterized protein LOC112842046 isoform X2 [Oreochromis niloticus]